MIHSVAFTLGYLLMILGGMAVSALLILAVAWLVNLAARSAWANIRNLYSITVITYWLDRLEREGWRTFERARSKKDTP